MVAPVSEPRVYVITPTEPHVRDSIEPGPASSYPGVRANGNGQLLIPENAIHLVRSHLTAAGIRFTDICRGPAVPDIQLDDVWPSEMRDFVRDYITNYQANFILRACKSAGTAAIHPTGSGKTLSTIIAGLAAPGPVVFVTKANAKRSVYERQIRQYTTLSPVVLDGLTARRLRKDVRAYIIGWETLSAWRDELLALCPTTVVWDEIHTARNPKRKRRIPNPDGTYSFESRGNVSDAAGALARLAKRRIGATATPIANRRIDLWSQLDILQPHGWGNYGQFATRYCAAKKNYMGFFDMRGESNTEDLQARLDTIFDVVPYSVANKELPPKRRVTIYLDRDQLDKPAAFANEKKKAARLGARKMLEAELMESATRKRSYVRELVCDALSSRQKVTIFTGRKKDSERLFAYLKTAIKKLSVQVACFHGTGDLTTKEREEIRTAYMAEKECALLVGTGDAWGESIELNETDVVIFVMLPYTPRQIIQWEGRFVRKGSTRPVLYYYVIAEGTRDEEVAGILLSKLPDVERMVGDEQVGGLAKSLEGLDNEEELIDDMIESFGGMEA